MLISTCAIEVGKPFASRKLSLTLLHSRPFSSTKPPVRCAPMCGWHRCGCVSKQQGGGGSLPVLLLCVPCCLSCAGMVHIKSRYRMHGGGRRRAAKTGASIPESRLDRGPLSLAVPRNGRKILRQSPKFSPSSGSVVLLLLLPPLCGCVALLTQTPP